MVTVSPTQQLAAVEDSSVSSALKPSVIQWRDQADFSSESEEWRSITAKF